MTGKTPSGLLFTWGAGDEPAFGDWRPIGTVPFQTRVLVGYCEDHPLGCHVKIGRLEASDNGALYWEVCDGEDQHDPAPDGSKYTPRWWMPLPRTPDAPR